MNTSKSLKEILLEALPVVVRQVSDQEGKLWTKDANRLKRQKARAAIVEAVEGLAPPELEQPKRYLREHTELQRAETKATVKGHNQCRDWFLEAIKEWQ